MEYWTCTTCNVITQLQSRDPHLSGKRHIAAATEEHQQRMLQAMRTQEAGGKWTCTICNIGMQLQSRDSHLAGKRHIAAVEENQQGILQASRAQDTGGKWTCTICNAEMHIHSRNPHLSGKRHTAAAEEQQQRLLQAMRTQEAEKKWTCTICNIEMQLQSRDSHLSGNQHVSAAQSRAYIPNYNGTASSSSSAHKLDPATSTFSAITGNAIYPTSDITKVHGISAVTVWPCTICGFYVPLSLKDSHLISVDHVKSLIEAIRVTCTAIPQPQIQVSNNHFREEENMDYQDVLFGVETLVTYLANRTSHKEVIPEISAMKAPLESVAHSRRRSRPETRAKTCPDCKTVLIGDNEAIHSCLNGQSLPVPPAGPLDSFFLSFPGYWYDSSIPLAESFRSFRQGLRRWNDWNGYSPNTWKEYEDDVYTRYQSALTKEFNLWFGTEDDIRSWHSLCRAIAIHPLPATHELCREAVQSRHVNIVDLVQWAREREVGQVKIFKTVKELSEYSYEENKIYRKDQIGQGVVLRHLLRRLASEGL